MPNVVVVIGAGAIGKAIARRIGWGKTILLADLRLENATQTAEDLRNEGYQAEVTQVDSANPESVSHLAQLVQQLGSVTHLVHTAGVSPIQATPEVVIDVDVVGTALVLEAFREVIAPGGTAIVISSQAAHMIPPLDNEQNQALATTPAQELSSLGFLQNLDNSMAAYCLAKRANVLRVQAEAPLWADRGARINSLSPGIIITPLAREELAGPGAAGYRNMLDACAAQRPGTPDEVAAAAEFIMTSPYITGTDLLIDGGVVAALQAGRIEFSTS